MLTIDGPNGGWRANPPDLAGARAVKEAHRYLAAGVPVGRYLADQLLVPMALAGGGAFRTLAPSLHATTNIAVIRAFLGVRVSVHGTRDEVTVEVRGA